MPTSAQPRQILVVDDDEGLLMLMTETLRAEGYAVSGARSGSALMACLAQGRPDLLLLDLKLKDAGGEALLQRMEREGLAVPFIVVTGQGDEKVAVAMMRRGALDYVSKNTALLDLLPGVVSRALRAVDRDRALAAEREQRQRLERELLEISENEQRRIGADLHDGLGQQLTAIEILCAGLKADVAGQPRLARQVDRIGQFLRESIAQVRSLARGLAPIKGGSDALWASLVELADRTHSLGRVECRLDCPAVVHLSDAAAAVQLYRIAQEAVNNALKHSRARRIVVALVRDAQELRLSVTDNGRGFVESRAAGLGLQVMRHRASVIGAELAVESVPGRGTTIRCRLPLRP
ncbi:MAG: response regulator [Opitutaceae bacterium]|nr:response regulator [Opitutaceae bacterium]